MPGLSDVLIAVVTHRGIGEETKRCIGNLCRAGAELLIASNASDIAYARSSLISAAVESCEKTGHSVIMLIDDDMVFTLQDALALVEHVRLTGSPVSAVYSNSRGELAACRQEVRGMRTWLTGLGFIAIGLKQLQELRDSLPKVWSQQDARNITPFCESYASASRNAWVNEDLDFCLKLRGVDMLPIGVGHVKPVPLYPDAETLRRIANNERLGSPEQAAEKAAE